MLLLLQVGPAGDSPGLGYEGEPELEEPDLGIDSQAAVCGVGGAVVPGPPPVVPVANSLDATRETGNMCNIYICMYVCMYVCMYIYII